MRRFDAWGERRARAGRLVATAILLATACGVRFAQAQAKPAAPKNEGTVGVVRKPKDRTSGLIFGPDWTVKFRDMPADWSDATNLANQLGMQEIFHPRNWNAHDLTPSIVFSFSRKQPGDETPAENMTIDERRSNAHYSLERIVPEPSLVLGPKQKAPVRIYEYTHGWDMVVYSESGPALFMTTLHCESAEECAPFKSFFARFVKSLQYQGNTSVLNEWKQR